MKSVGIVNLLILFLVGGVLGGGIFGLIFALCIFGVIYSPETLILFSIIVSLFYAVSIWRQIRKNTYLVIVRKFVEIVFIASLLNAMFLLDEELVTFNSFDWNVIYICVGFAIIIMTAFFVSDLYFKKSWIYKEISHIINGMQIYGLLPNFADEDKEEKEIGSK